MSRFKLVALDWNGTCLDDAGFQYRCIRHTFEHYKVACPSFEEYYDALDRMHWLEIFYHYGIPRSVTLKDMGALRYSFMMHFWTPSLVRNALWEILFYCFEQRIRLVLATGEMPELIEYQLERVGIRHYFDLILSGRERKDTALEGALALYLIAPAEALFADDMPQCIREAKNVGVYTVGITTGFTKKETIEKAEPDATVASLDEVARIIKQSS